MNESKRSAIHSARLSGLVVLSLILMPGSACANMVMFHGSGELGERELFFTSFSTIMDRTPMDAIFGPMSVHEIEVIGVYEKTSKPDWAEMKLQFECPVEQMQQWPGRRRRSAEQAPKKLPAPLRWRMAERSYQFTRDADQVPLPQTQWQSISDPAIFKAGMFACNNIMVRSAISSAGGSSSVDNAKLNAALAPLGIGDVAWVNGVGNVLSLASFTWSHLWKAQRPRGKRDRQLSSAEIARNQEELARIAREMDRLDAQAQAFAKPIIEADQAEQAFLATVQRVRAGRQVTELESSLLAVWLAKPEELVVARLGTAPRVSEAGGLRFISYDDQADTRTAVVSAASGRVLSQSGAYSACEVTFVAAQDAKNAWRVADIRIQSTGPAGDMCRSLLNTPHD